MKILRDDGEEVPGDEDDGAEIGLAGGDDEGGGEEDDDDVEDHDPEGGDVEVDVGAVDGDVFVHLSGDAVKNFMTLLRKSAAYPHAKLCQGILLAPDASSDHDHQAYICS